VISPPYHIETERLLLRPYAESDLDALYAIQSREDVARFLYWEPRQRDEVQEVIRRRISTGIHGEGDTLLLAIVPRDVGVVVGDVSLTYISEAHSQGEIGFVLHPDHQGNGYASEAARELLRIGFEDLGLHRVIGRCEARNDASARLMERLGMRREAHLVENEWVKGEWQSELVFAILASAWAAQR
jgi:RimJ/RimL family protein N-acetyltransferase